MPTFQWEVIRTKMLISAGTLLLGGIGYLIYPVGWTIQQDVADLKKYVIAHEITVTNIVAEFEAEDKKQQKQLEQLLDYHKRDYEVVGTGSVGTFGADEAYVRVNRRSLARIYKDGDSMVITCDVEGKPKAVFQVRGTFSDSNQDLVISFSQEAADELGITSRVGVEIEPVTEE